MVLRLKDKKEIAKGVWQYTLDKVGQKIDFEPGQFFTLSLINPEFSDNRGSSRIFGFTNNSTQPDIEFITYAGSSAFKKSLQKLVLGSEVEIDKINGSKILPDNPSQKSILVADVIGLAPFLSVLRKIRDDKLDLEISLLYIFDNPETAICLLELESFAMQNSKFKLIKSNNFTVDLITQNVQNFKDCKYFIRGEQKFVIPVFSSLKELGIDATNLSMEIFTGY